MLDSTEVYWLTQTFADVPQDDSWLSAKERAFAGRMHFEKRRQDWRLGRWTAKQAMLHYLSLPSGHDQASRLEILAAADGAPEAFLDGIPAPAALSISHSAGIAFCAVAATGLALGCDLEEIRPREDNFAADYFTNEELRLLEQAASRDRPLLITLIWSAKESALKALRHGLRRDTRSVQVLLTEPGHDGWNSLAVLDLEFLRTLPGWWRTQGSHIQTVTTGLVTAPPREGLQPPAAQRNKA